MGFFRLAHTDQTEGASDQSSSENVAEASQAIELKSIARTYNQDVNGDHPENSKLNGLRGKNVYSKWAVEVEKSLKAKGLWGAITPRQRPATAFEKSNGQEARTLILQHLSTVKAKSLSFLTSASDIWKQHKIDASYCPTCLDLSQDIRKATSVRTSAFKRSALDGCGSCQLLLDAADAYAPGWIGDIVEKALVPGSNAEDEPERLISLEISNYFVRVTLLRREGLDLEETCFDIFNQTGEYHRSLSV